MKKDNAPVSIAFGDITITGTVVSEGATYYAVRVDPGAEVLAGSVAYFDKECVTL